MIKKILLRFEYEDFSKGDIGIIAESVSGILWGAYLVYTQPFFEGRPPLREDFQTGIRTELVVDEPGVRTITNFYYKENAIFHTMVLSEKWVVTYTIEPGEYEP